MPAEIVQYQVSPTMKSSSMSSSIATPAPEEAFATGSDSLATRNHNCDRFCVHKNVLTSSDLWLLTFHNGADQLANHCRNGAALRRLVYLILTVQRSRLKQCRVQAPCTEQAPHCGVDVAAVVKWWPCPGA
jgi:hypothetical protein